MWRGNACKAPCRGKTEPADLLRDAGACTTGDRVISIGADAATSTGVDVSRRKDAGPAIEGQGVALARSQLVTEDLRAGRLIRPFEVETPAPLAYYFVCREESLRSNKVSVFRDWVLDEVRRDGEPRGAD